MFLLAAMVCVLLFRTFLFRRHWVRRLRTDETLKSCTHNRAYQAASEKQTGFWPVRTPYRAIYACTGEVSAARLRTGNNRYRTYSTEVTSSPSNLPLPRSADMLSHARSNNIAGRRAAVKGNFVIFAEFLLEIL